jgi:tungstate transport system substrate-binding protein
MRRGAAMPMWCSFTPNQRKKKFLAEGEGVKRFPVMYNDFVLIGPKDDPAGIKGRKDVAKAFQIIKESRHVLSHAAITPAHISPS